MENKENKCAGYQILVSCLEKISSLLNFIVKNDGRLKNSLGDT